MNLEYTNRHKNSSKKKNILIVLLIVGILAALTFIGGFLDYLFSLNIITYVMFAVAFILAYILFKKCIFEYKYGYSDEVFTVERLIDDSTKLIFVSDKKFIIDFLPYDDCIQKYGSLQTHNFSFSNKKDCYAVVYNNEEKKKAALICVDESFAASLGGELLSQD